MKKIGKTIGMIILGIGTIVTISSVVYLIGEGIYEIIKNGLTDTGIFIIGVIMLLVGASICVLFDDL